MPANGSPLTPPAAPAWTPFAAAALGGILYALGYAGWGWWPLLGCFLVPLWDALERSRARPARRAMLLGLVFGLAAYAGGFLWLWALLDGFLSGRIVLGAALWLAVGGWFALGFAAYALLYRQIRRRGWSIALAGIAPLLLLEWLQPQLFPVNAGAGLVHAPRVIQLAEVGGPLLLTALLGAVNLVAVETWRWRRGGVPAPVRLWAVGAGAAAAVVAVGELRVASLERTAAAAPALTVGMVQANLGVLEKRELALVTHERHLEQTRELLAAGPVDLVVWPETAYVRGIRRPLPVSGLPVRQEIAVPLLFGGSSVRDVDGRRVKSNSAFLVASDGDIHDVYDKNLLIPFAEHVPVIGFLSAVAEAFPHAQDFDAAQDTPALRLGPWRIATPICYEAVRADLVRRMVRASQPHLLVTLANDAWFGDSQEPWLHLALARLRAVEHRRFLVRATNSGVSAVVDPAGRIVARTGLLTRENLRGTVRLLDGTTLYGRFGDWPGWIAAVLVLGALVVRRSSADAAGG